MNNQVKESSNISSKFLGLYFLIPSFTLQFSSELMLFWCSQGLTQFLEAHLMGAYTSEVSSYDNMKMAQWKRTSLDQIVSSISSYSSYLIIHMIGKFHANPGKPYSLVK